MHKAKLNITKPQYSDGRQKISIRVEDVDAHVNFLEIEIDLDNFARCVTGHGNIECEMSFRALDKVGKKEERKELEFEIPESKYSDRKDIAIKQAHAEAPVGWIPSEYFGSKSSFFEKDGKEYARTMIYRWVEKEPKK